jgi:hypothetical protein
MELPEPTTVEDLVRRHAPDLIPQSDRGVRLFVQFAVFMVIATISVTTLGAIGAHSSSWGPFVLGLAGALSIGWVIRRDHQAKLRLFSRQLRESPWIFYEVVASKFAAAVEVQRARTIGPDSEWGRARLSLESAAQEADRSVAYWTHRLSSDAEIATTQLAAATRLRDKFRTALSGLDQRAHLLVTFFNERGNPSRQGTRWPRAHRPDSPRRRSAGRSDRSSR